MKKILMSSVALAVMTAGAMAADLPSRRAAPAPVASYVAVPVFTWTGFYIGANAGYGFSDNNNGNGINGNGAGLFANGTSFGTGISPVIPPAGTFFANNNGNRNRDGFVGGGQIGYNYQFGNIVLGVEGDIQYTDFGRRRGNGGTLTTAIPQDGNIAAGSPNVAFFNGQNGHSDYFGTVRGRLGYAMDRTLIYGTGGVAFRDTGRNDEFFFGRSTGFQGKREDTGYAVGGGIEYAFTPSLTAKIEGLYVNFEGDRRNNNGFNNLGGQIVGVTNTARPIVAVGSRGNQDDFAVVRAGINYKFNGF